MSIPKINNDHILKVKGAFDLYSSVHLGRVNLVTAYLDTFSEVELWLFTFTYYVMICNRKWKGVDFSKYYVVPSSQEQQSTFQDFIKLLATYRNRTVTYENEKELILFLRGCTKEIRDYYEIVLSRPKEAENLYMKKELRSYLDMTKIRAEDIYGDASFLRQGWKNLTYPLMITTVPSPTLARCVIYKNGGSLKISKYLPKKQNELLFTKVPVPVKWLEKDRKAIHTTTFLLVGLIDEENNNFYPLDYFNTTKEYSAFRRKSKDVIPYEKRLVNLEKFLSTNYLRQIKKRSKIYCISSSQISVAAATVLAGSPHNTILLCDGKDRIMFSETYELEGIIGDYWKNEVGEVLGFKVWNNGREVLSSFDFTGENHPLLYNPQLVLGKYARFHLFQYKDFEAGAVVEILFDKPLYKPTPYTFRDGKVGYIECCPFCLLDHTPHSHNGICDNTLKNWYTMLASKGPDKWFAVTDRLAKRRLQKRWRPEFLNNITAVFKGYRVVASPEGLIMFQTDPEAAELYAQRVAHLTKSGWMPEIKHKTQEELYNSYASRFNLKRKDQDGAKEPQGLHRD